MRGNIRKFLRGPKGKKYTAVLRNGEKINFGGEGYEQYKDRIGLYSHMDHGDKVRRKRYFLRHSGVPTKEKALQKELNKSGGKLNAKILSHQYLW